MRANYDVLRKHVFSKDREAFPKQAFTVSLPHAVLLMSSLGNAMSFSCGDDSKFTTFSSQLKEWIWAYVLYDSRVIQLDRNTGSVSLVESGPCSFSGLMVSRVWFKEFWVSTSCRSVFLSLLRVKRIFSTSTEMLGHYVVSNRAHVFASRANLVSGQSCSWSVQCLKRYYRSWITWIV